MAYFQNKNTNLGKILRVLQWKMLVYFMAILSISRPFSIFCGNLVYFMVLWNIFPVLVCCTKKNLATLAPRPCKQIRRHAHLFSFWLFLSLLSALIVPLSFSRQKKTTFFFSNCFSFRHQNLRNKRVELSHSRVARGFVFKPKIPIWVNIGGS
jgi:hypothetical protein